MDIKKLPEDDQERSKLFGILTDSCKNKFNVSASVVLFYEMLINARVTLTVMQRVNEYKIYMFIFWKNVRS